MLNTTYRLLLSRHRTNNFSAPPRNNASGENPPPGENGDRKMEKRKKGDYRKKRKKGTEKRGQYTFCLSIFYLCLCFPCDCLYMLYSGLNLVAEYTTSDTNPNTVRNRYVPGPGTDEPLVWYTTISTASEKWGKMARLHQSTALCSPLRPHYGMDPRTSLAHFYASMSIRWASQANINPAPSKHSLSPAST